MVRRAASVALFMLLENSVLAKRPVSRVELRSSRGSFGQVGWCPHSEPVLRRCSHVEPINGDGSQIHCVKHISFPARQPVPPEPSSHFGLCLLITLIQAKLSETFSYSPTIQVPG